MGGGGGGSAGRDGSESGAPEALTLTQAVTLNNDQHEMHRTQLALTICVVGAFSFGVMVTLCLGVCVLRRSKGQRKRRRIDPNLPQRASLVAGRARGSANGSNGTANGSSANGSGFGSSDGRGSGGRADDDHDDDGGGDDDGEARQCLMGGAGGEGGEGGYGGAGRSAGVLGASYQQVPGGGGGGGGDEDEDGAGKIETEEEAA
jgi:hypothetical protein